jgi:diguanylate cyclase (GGDEF)-like protein
LDEEISRSRRISLPLSMITLDIDNFQELNNVVGFGNADSVLKVIGALLKKTVRANDILARIGADEIALLLPHTSHMGAAIKAERVRRILESTRFPSIEGKGPRKISVSVGVSEYPSFCNDAEGLIKSADEALYQVKQAGGNRVCLATPPPGFTPDFVPKKVEDARAEAKP